jgi:hypothetical protein
MSECAGYSRVISDGTIYHCSTMVAGEAVIAGCVHEHVGPRLLCEYHADELRSGGQLCGDCLDLGHRCVLVELPRPATSQVRSA